MRIHVCLLFLLLLPGGIWAQRLSSSHLEASRKSRILLDKSPANSIKPPSTNVSQKLMLSEATQILAQASIVSNWEELEKLSSIGLKSWIAEQKTLAPTLCSDKLKKWEIVLDELGYTSNSHPALIFDLAIWQNNLIAKDQLRQRIAGILDRTIFRPTSHRHTKHSSLEQANYYDKLITHALGNYQDLSLSLATDPILQNLLPEQGVRNSSVHTRQKELEKLFKQPFLAHQLSHSLIRELITPNPTLEYVNRVAAVFEDNGKGIRGDMSAVIYAIFYERLQPDFIDKGINIDQVLLHEPFLQYLDFCKDFDKATEKELKALLAQKLTRLPEYDEVYPGVTDFSNPFSPTNNSLTSSYPTNNQNTYAQFARHFIEEVEAQALVTVSTARDLPNLKEEEIIFSDELDKLIGLSAKPQELVNYLNLIFVQGRLSDRNKMTILEAIQKVEDKEERFSLALYLILISPDYSLVGK